MERLRKYQVTLTEPSLDITYNYLVKAQNCCRAATLLHKAKLYENAISQSYYGMYCSTIGLLRACGISCESHKLTIILLRELFSSPSLSLMLQSAKRERIEKQYFITNAKAVAEESAELIENSEVFVANIRVIIGDLTPQSIECYREILKSKYDATSI